MNPDYASVYAGIAEHLARKPELQKKRYPVLWQAAFMGFKSKLCPSITINGPISLQEIPKIQWRITMRDWLKTTAIL